MMAFDASGRTGQPLNCIVCEREIVDDNWFARIKAGPWRVVMCRPRCVEIFLENRESCLRRLNGSFGDNNSRVESRNLRVAVKPAPS